MASHLAIGNPTSLMSEFPSPLIRIHKQKCCVSFPALKFKGGLFIDTGTFPTSRKDCVDWNYEDTRSLVHSHIRQTKKLVSEDRSMKKLTVFGYRCWFYWNCGDLDEYASPKNEVPMHELSNSYGSLYGVSCQMLVGHERRFLMFNGAIGKEQMGWLDWCTSGCNKVKTEGSCQLLSAFRSQ